VARAPGWSSGEVGLYLLLAWAPLPLGSNRPWSWMLLTVLAGGVLALQGLTMLLGRSRDGGISAWPWAAGLFWAGGLSWAVAQLWPGAPAEWVHPARLAAQASGFDSSATISIDPLATREAVLRLAAYAAVFCTALMVSSELERARRLLLAVGAITALYAGFALLRAAAGWELSADLPAGEVTGPFPNRNHFATYVNLGLLAMLALLIEAVRRQMSSESLRHGLVQIARALVDRAWLLLVASVALLSASLLSASRGGFLSLIVAVGLLVTLSMRHWGRYRRMAWLAAAVFVVGLGLIVSLAGDLVLDRLETVGADNLSTSGSGRLAGWLVSLQAWMQRPWLGHGYGAYAALFDTIRDERFATAVYDYAHNTYVELLVELGWPATLALLVAMVLLVRRCARNLDGPNRIAGLVGLTASVLVGIHALVDFSLQIPAVAVTYAALLGAGCGAGTRSGGGGSSRRGTRRRAAATNE
jgi:O-antigen ligase